MFVLYPLLASAIGIALVFFWSDTQSGILIMLGALLFAGGTLLRRKLSANQETTDSTSRTQWVEPKPSSRYIARVGSIGTAAVSRQHANVG